MTSADVSWQLLYQITRILLSLVIETRLHSVILECTASRVRELQYIIYLKQPRTRLLQYTIMQNGLKTHSKINCHATNYMKHGMEW